MTVRIAGISDCGNWRRRSLSAAWRERDANAVVVDDDTLDVLPEALLLVYGGGARLEFFSESVGSRVSLCILIALRYHDTDDFDVLVAGGGCVA